MSPAGPPWGPAIRGVVTRLPRSETARIALTLDACGGPGGDGYDADLIAFLRAERIAATLFLSARWIRAHPQRATELAATHLFEIENHGDAHKPCSVAGRVAFGVRGTRSAQEARAEVVVASEAIEALTGGAPRFFRPGTGYFDEGCIDVVKALGLVPLGFTVAGDAGGGFSRERVRETVERAADGTIVLLHMNQPDGMTAEGFADALPALRKRNLAFVHLSEAFPAAAEDR